MMNRTIKKIFYSMSANVISVITSVLIVIILPKLVDVNDYGALQLFLFYISYVGFLHFGWEDGIYLRYAGISYKNLNKSVFSGQIYGIVILQTLILSFLFIYALIFASDSITFFVIECTGISAVLINFNNIVNLILQFTNRIKAYSYRMIMEKICLVVFLIFFVGVGMTSYHYLVVAFLLSFFIVSILCVYSIKDLFTTKIPSLSEIYYEGLKNINVGIKLMLSNISGMLIVGIIRYGISLNWPIGVFGGISLILSVSNFFMVFINAISVVAFPILKKIDETKLSISYIKMRNGLSFISFTCIFIYFPVKLLLIYWLPEYIDSVIFLPIIFPLFFFQGKICLLLNTFFKTMRLEKTMLKANISAVVFSIFLVGLSIKVFHSIELMMFDIMIVSMYQCIISEVFLSKKLYINIKTGILNDIVLASSFTIFTYFWGDILGFVMYLFIYILYSIKNSNQIKEFLLYLNANKC